MNHQVEDHVHIEGAGREDREPVGLKKHGTAEIGLDGEDGGIETLQMAGLEDAVAIRGSGKQVVGFGQRCGEGLFDQQVEAGFEQRRGYGVVMDGGNGNSGGVEAEIGGEQCRHVWKNGEVVFGGGFGGAGGVGLDGGDQGATLPGGLKLTVDAEMVAAKCAGAGDGDTEDGLACYFAAPGAGSLPSTAWRQRL